ncbi:Type 4 prepilin-like proteins leader peptide-processing enzyme [Vibrio stylophorae]|uniref:Prepilin leader peptidase/N-methyltransferase n=1 Tax=Vibrio stylophorae TaxID=659351 RepID=A0ABN8DUJ6_9VIBR|nr:A24 family peptidase [Vibrio stylophorae]CAH0534437.1 Type 4 prepilin-like proteins leader peptide-processing enzyme [Vibrio stylophorae]
MAALFELYPWTYPFLITFFGLLVGSFLNVVVYRLPIMMKKQWQAEVEEYQQQPQEDLPEGTFNLVVPRSRCPQCNHAISALENIPVISWLCLGGKCRSCKSPISKRYPTVELISAIMALTVAWVLPFSYWSLALVFATFALISLTLIDLDEMLLPDQITLPLMWAGILLALLNLSPLSLEQSVIGAMAGYLSLWSVYWAFKLLTGKEGMGYGDFKLLAALGAWGGWQILPLVILISSLLGAVVGVIMMRRNPEQGGAIPFGPYLAAAGWIALLWGPEIIAWYLGLYAA